MCAAGNDLARVLRWGPGFTGAEEPLNILRDVIEAEAIRLDRYCYYLIDIIECSFDAKSEANPQ
jgi:hypothetical protein